MRLTCTVKLNKIDNNNFYYLISESSSFQPTPSVAGTLCRRMCKDRDYLWIDGQIYSLSFPPAVASFCCQESYYNTIHIIIVFVQSHL